jgi:large-conductance mechanosensitive channel
VFCSYVALPDEGANRMLLITLPFLFILAMTEFRWLSLWAVSILGAAAVLVEFRNTGIGLIEQVFGSYGSLKHVLFANLLMAFVVFYYVKDKVTRTQRERAASSASSAESSPALT